MLDGLPRQSHGTCQTRRPIKLIGEAKIPAEGTAVQFLNKAKCPAERRLVVNHNGARVKCMPNYRLATCNVPALSTR